jgi:hypothetical protein
MTVSPSPCGVISSLAAVDAEDTGVVDAALVLQAASGGSVSSSFAVVDVTTVGSSEGTCEGCAAVGTITT